MATTQNLHNGNGSTTIFSYTFPALKDADVKAEVDNALTTAFTLLTSPTRVQFSSAPAAGTNNVRIFRDTEVDAAKAVFAAGSSIRAQDLNNNMDQFLYAAQEEQGATITTHRIADNAVTSAKIKDGTIVDADISATAEIAVSKLADGAARQVLQTAADGTTVEWTSNVDIPGTLDVAGNTDLDGTLNVDGSTQLEACGVDGDFNVNTNKFTVAASSGNTVVAGTLRVDGHTDLNSTATIDGNTHIQANLTVDGVLDANGSATIDNVQIGVSGDNEIDTSSGNLILDSASGTVQVTDAFNVTGNSDFDGTVNIDGTLTVDSVTGDFIVTSGTSNSDTKVYSAKRAEELFFNATTTETIKDGDTFPDNDTSIATTAAINDRIIDLVDDVGGFWPIANETSFPSANPDVNNGPGTIVSIKALTSAIVTGSGVTTHTITNGAGSGNNVIITGLTASTTYAVGMGMLVETTSTLHTYAFHRLSPKATEVTTIAGSIANINTVANNIAKVTTCADDLNESTSEIDTVANNITNVNNVGNNIANVNTVATNVNDVNNFADLYQIATSAPSTDGGGNALAEGDLWYDSSSNKQMKVHNGTAFAAVTPSQSVLDDIAIVSGNITFAEDLGLITDALTTGTGNSIETAADNIANIQRLGTADAVSDMNTLGTAAIVADMNLLGTADCVADMAILGTTDAVADMNTLATTANVNNMNTVAGISANVTTVAGVSSNVTTVAGISSDVTAVAADATDIGAVAGKATEIGRLGTTAAVADMALLGTTACVADMAILGTADVVSDLNTLATADVVSDLNTLGTADVVSDMNTLATGANVTAMDNCSGSIANINTTAGSITNVNTTAGSIANVNTTAGSISNVNTVAGSIADVNRYANEYQIAGSTPGSPSEGDLWYNSSGNTLNYYNGSSWVGISPGIAAVVSDSSPQLGGHLNANSKNITNGGTFTASSFVGALTGNASGSSGSCTGNAATATTLANARTIGGVSFNGSANINLPGVNTAGNQNTSGTAAGLSGSPNISVGTISGTNLQIDFGTLT